MAQQRKKIPKGARKKFFEVPVALTSTKVQLYTYAPNLLDGKVIKLDLTKNLRGKNLELKAKIKEKNGELTSDLMSLELNRQYIIKSMRKGADYVEDSFKAPSKDFNLQIKFLLLTRKRVSRSIRNLLREQAKKLLLAKIKTRFAEDIFTETMTGKIQKELSQKLKKIYPLGFCEIKFLKVISPLKKENKTKETSLKSSEELEKQ